MGGAVDPVAAGRASPRMGVVVQGRRWIREGGSVVTRPDGGGGFQGRGRRWFPAANPIPRVTRGVQTSAYVPVAIAGRPIKMIPVFFSGLLFVFLFLSYFSFFCFFFCLIFLSIYILLILLYLTFLVTFLFFHFSLSVFRFPVSFLFYVFLLCIFFFLISFYVYFQFSFFVFCLFSSLY